VRAATEHWIASEGSTSLPDLIREALLQIA
jgi:hypothetical protein